MSSKTKPSKGKSKKTNATRPQAKAAPAKAKAQPKPAAKAKPSAKPAAPEKARPEAKGKPPVAAKGAPPAKGAVAPVKGAAPAKGAIPAKGAVPAKGAPAAKGAAPAKGPKGRKSSRRPSLLRRGPDGEILAPGDLLLPGGAQRLEELLYLFRGSSAAEHPVGEDTIGEELAKRPEPPAEKDDVARGLGWARERFERGSIEPAIPPRPNVRRTFQGVLERAKQRRREIGAFLRGLDLGHTESSHMDAHGEASLTSLMKLAAGLENLAEAEEPPQTDATEFHRVFEQLEAATETLIIDVEQTLRRLRDRIKA
jgi:hypothetical protein